MHARSTKTQAQPARGPIDVRIRDEYSRGALAVVETVVVPGSGPPLHTHPSLDEHIYVLEGTLSFRVGDALFTALPGASVSAPRGTPQTYSNRSGKVARVLLVCTPEHSPPAIHHSEIVGPPLQP